MPSPLPFCRIKVQYLAEAALDPSVDDSAFRVISYLALIHADHTTGEARPSFVTIAQALGRHPKSVKRALKRAEDAGYLEIERRAHCGKSSRYWPSEGARSRAVRRKKEGDKVVPLSPRNGGQICPERGTEWSREGGQICPPNRDQELTTPAREAEFSFVPENSAAAREWQNLCDRHLGRRLGTLVDGATRDGERGFILPSRWPPVDRGEWAGMAGWLLRQSRGQDKGVRHG